MKERAMEMQEHGKLLTTREVMKCLKVSRSTVMRLIARGDLSAHKVGNNLRFYERDIRSAVKVARDARHQMELSDTEGH